MCAASRQCAPDMLPDPPSNSSWWRGSMRLWTAYPHEAPSFMPYWGRGADVFVVAGRATCHSWLLVMFLVCAPPRLCLRVPRLCLRAPPCRVFPFLCVPCRRRSLSCVFFRRHPACCLSVCCLFCVSIKSLPNGIERRHALALGSVFFFLLHGSICSLHPLSWNGTRV